MDHQEIASLVEAPISLLQQLLSTRSITSTELCALYLHRISTYDTRGLFLNSIPLINPNLFAEAAASDARHAAGRPLGPLDGVPYTLKDSFKYMGMTVAAGSPAFVDIQPNENAHLAKVLEDAGAVVIGKTNMPPMACGGMQRGLYGRAESPYNSDYLTAAFSSGSSNGSATSTAASFSAFGLGSETVSSGRSPASNNGLVCYTPSRGLLSCRGLWPLYVTCDVPVPHTRSLEDMLILLDVLVQTDLKVQGDFWREQTNLSLPNIPMPTGGFLSVCDKNALDGKRIAVPRMYIGGRDSNPNTKYPFVSEHVKKLWKRAQTDLESLGATCIESDFPLVTRYEDDSVSGLPNNVRAAPTDWNQRERSDIISYAWDDFLIQNQDENHRSLGDCNADLIFPLPNDFVPSRFAEVKNLVNYPSLVDFVKAGNRHGKSISEIDGMAIALHALESQRKRDLEDWMDANGFDAVVFPANGDVGRADLEENPSSAEHALLNGVKYSNGNRAIRHLGVPTVSVTMGVMENNGMPVNLTICGKAGSDVDLLRYAYAYEQQSQRRFAPPLTPALVTDSIVLSISKASLPPATTKIELEVLRNEKQSDDHHSAIFLAGTISPPGAKLSIFVDGASVDKELVHINGKGEWKSVAPFTPFDAGQPGYGKWKGGDVLATKVMVVLLAKAEDRAVKGELVIV